MDGSTAAAVDERRTPPLHLPLRHGVVVVVVGWSVTIVEPIRIGSK